MTKVTTKAVAKVVAVATGLAMATSMLSYAPMAHAASLTDSQVQSILSLLSSFGANSAVIANVNAALTGQASTGGSTGGSASSCSFTMDLHLGSSGTQVTCLQNALIANGFSISAGATGYFGTQTQAAVKAWQMSKNIAPALGYFGPLSRSAFSLGSGSTGGTTDGGTTTTGPLSGNGRLTNISSLGDITSDVKEGDSATPVIGVSGQASNGDVAIQRVDATFTIANSGGQSSNLNQYVSNVSLYLGDTKLASMDPASGDKDGRVWTLRFSGLNGVIKNGSTGNLHVKVTPLTSIGTNEDGKTVTAKLLIDSVRAVGGDGISDTYISGSDITQAFTISSQTNGTLTVSTADDNPKASQVAVSSSTTTGVKLLSFNVKAKNQASTITDMAVSFGTSDSLSDVINTVRLMKGSTVLSSKTVSTGTYGVITFNDVAQTIGKDVTQNYWVSADFKADSAYADGTTVIASSTTAGWDVSDSGGASITPSAAAVGNTMTLTATGISVVKGAVTAVVTAGGASSDTGTYTIPFTVTAGDSDVYLSSVTTNAATPSASNGGVNYATTTSSTSVQAPTLATSFSASDSLSGDTSSLFKVSAGTSRTFTLVVSATPTVTGIFGIRITGINYSNTTSMGATYYTSNLDTFKTNDINLVKR